MCIRDSPMREISKPLVTKIGDYAEIARYFPNRINTQIMKAVSYTHLDVYKRQSVEKGQVFGCQFHPEKSSDIGIQILQNFVEL